MRNLTKALIGFGLVALVAVAVAYGARAHKSASDTLVFGSSADPVALDGALISDGESGRVVIQIFEGLVNLKPGTTTVIPALATSWKGTNGGKSWTFTLRKNVKFTDGTPFNAAAACANFNRWYNFTGSFQNPSATYYWQTVFGGFKKYDPKSGAPKGSLFKSCKANGSSSITINLTARRRRSSARCRCRRSRWRARRRWPSTARTRAASTRAACSTRPARMRLSIRLAPARSCSSRGRVGDKLTLVRNPNYWGAKAKLSTLIFKPIADNAARLQALQNGEIQGYDLVEPQDIPVIQQDSNLKLLVPPAVQRRRSSA